jgi:hypothetical protein
MEPIVSRSTAAVSETSLQAADNTSTGNENNHEDGRLKSRISSPLRSRLDAAADT